MPSVMPAALLVSVFPLMFLFLKHLAIHCLCQDYFEVMAILPMSALDPLMLKEFMAILSLLCSSAVVEEEERDHGWVPGLTLSGFYSRGAWTMQYVAACRLLQSSTAVRSYCCCLHLRLRAVARWERPGPGAGANLGSDWPGRAKSRWGVLGRSRIRGRFCGSRDGVGVRKEAEVPVRGNDLWLELRFGQTLWWEWTWA